MKKVLNFTLLLCVFASTVNASPIFAQGFGPPPAGLDDLETMIGQVVTVIVALGFIALLVMVVMAGFKYLTSGGEPKALQSAHQTLSWAVLGIFFMIIAWLALLLIKAFTGVDVTVFDIKKLCGPGNQFCPISSP